MWIIYPLIFLAGFIDSIAGGGGLISLTSYLAVGLPAHLALGTNKLSAVFGTGISAARFAKNGYVEYKSAALSFLGALAGSAIGARTALFLNERALTIFMLFAVPAVSFTLLLKRDFGIRERQLPPLRMAVLSLLIGLCIGAYDGLFGPGTGTFLIMAFTTFLGMNLLTSCGNAKVVNFASNIAAAVTFTLNGEVNLKIGIPCAFCAILGNWAGSGLAMKNGVKIVRPMMFVVIGLLILKIVLDIIL